MDHYVVLFFVSFAGLVCSWVWDRMNGYTNNAAKALGFFCFFCVTIFVIAAVFSLLRVNPRIVQARKKGKNV